MYTEIKNDNQYYTYAKDYEVAENNINLAYNELRNTSEENQERILELQNYIDKYKQFIEGMFNLLSRYIAGKEKEKVQVHEVKYGETLPMLAQIYYNKPTYWQRIFVENDLVSTELTVGQELVIPKKNPKVNNPVVYSSQIVARDVLNLKYNFDKINIRG